MDNQRPKITADQFRAHAGGQVFGVIDLWRGQAVHAVAGKRDRYQPVRLPGATDGDVDALVEHYLAAQVDGFYVADLDAIREGNPQWQLLRQILQRGIPTWLDLGLVEEADLVCARDTLAGYGDATWVIATESAGIHLSISNWLTLVPPDRIVLSVDLLEGALYFSDDEFFAPFDDTALIDTALEKLSAEGLRKCLVLDIGVVGTQRGPVSLEICARLKQRYPNLVLATGGGIRTLADYQRIRETGCEVVLVATALLPRQGAVEH